MQSNLGVSAGGSLHSSLSNGNLTIAFTVIKDSLAGYGGSIFLGTDHDQVNFDHVKITTSSGFEGGAIYVSQFNQYLNFAHCVFLSCSASLGGAVITSFAGITSFQSSYVAHSVSTEISGLDINGGYLLISNSIFENNTAMSTVSSGAVTMTFGNVLELVNSTFRSNIAYYGGGLSATEIGIVHISNCTFSENVASTGGGIYLFTINDLLISNSKFLLNQALSSGAACFVYITEFIIDRVHFEKNIATGYGGGLMISSSTGLVSDTTFVNNSVWEDGGSAIYLETSEFSLANNFFSHNSVLRGGGSVFWFTWSFMKEPEGLRNSSLNTFVDNFAPYGPNWATEPVSIFPSVICLNVTTYGSTLPFLLVALADSYNQVIVTDSKSTVEVQVFDSSLCNGVSAYATGGLIETFKNGIANFSSLQVFCSPGSSVKVKFRANLVDSKPTAIVTLIFRDCIRGEYYSSQECVACESGTYSLSEDKSDLSNMNQISVCKPCPPHVNECYGDTLFLREGFWRISSSSEKILSCPYGQAACQGGDAAGEKSCHEGYGGPLCAVCTAGYALQQSPQTCVPCSQSAGLDVPDLIFLIILSALLFIVIYYFTWPHIHAQIKSFDDFVLFCLKIFYFTDEIKESQQKEVIQFTKNFTRRLLARLKVYITMYQILSALPFVLDLSFPSPVSSIISALNFINLSISGSAIMSCSTNSYDFIDVLLINTLYPLCFVLVLFSIRSLHIYYIRFRRSDSESDQLIENQIISISSNYFSISLIFSYFILPSVATTIFQTFSCHDVDPDDSSPGSDRYMTADYSVSCNSEKYSFGFIWAIVMIFIYPIGFPCYYFYLLWNIRGEIKSRNSSAQNFPSEDQADIPTHQYLKYQNLLSLRFLYESYHPYYWYWELIETTQRLLLTGLLVLIAQGSAVQIIVGALLTLSFLYFYIKYEPFCDELILSVKIVSYWQIFFVFWIALLVKADFPSISSSSLGIWFVLVIFINLIFDCYKLFSTLITRWKKKYVRYSSQSNQRSPSVTSQIPKDTENQSLSLHCISNSIDSQNELRTYSIRGPDLEEEVTSPVHPRDENTRKN